MEPRDMAENCEQAGDFDIIDKRRRNIEIEELISGVNQPGGPQRHLRAGSAYRRRR